MRVTNFQIYKSGSNYKFSADFIFDYPSLSSRLANLSSFFDNHLGGRHTIWFKVPLTHADTDSYQDGFFTIAMAFAFIRHEDLIFEGKVKDSILAKYEEFKKYYAFDTGVEYNLKIYHQGIQENLPKKRGVAQFFTLGLDSFYTLLCHQPNYKKLKRDLLFVGGYDIPLEKRSFLNQIYRRIKVVAKQVGGREVFIETNLRVLSNPIVNWGRYHMSALATSAMFLNYKHVIINGESFEFPDWGLRHGIDELFSNNQTHFSYAAHNMTRDKKIRGLQKSPLFSLVIAHLRVCWENILSEPVPYNCSNCQKCIRTQLNLLGLGVNKLPTFKQINPGKLSSLTIVDHVQKEWQTLYKMLINKRDIDPKIISAIWTVLQKPLRR